MVTLKFIYFAFLLLLMFFMGFLLSLFINKPKTRQKDNTKIPIDIPTLSSGEARAIELYQNEWESVLETQRHFNNLIIKFRGSTLTGFVFLTGLTVTAEELLKGENTLAILTLIFFFWIATAILDLCYYHKLLLGAVEYADDKFDKHEGLKSQGFFGLTTKVKHTISPMESKFFILLYYMIPIIALMSLYIWSTLRV